MPISDFSTALQRRPAMGIVLAGFGLSGAMYAAVATYVLLGDTGKTLLLLALGPAVAMSLASRYLKPVLAAVVPSTKTATTEDSQSLITINGEPAANPVVYSSSVPSSPELSLNTSRDNNIGAGPASLRETVKRRSISMERESLASSTASPIIKTVADIGGLSLFSHFDFWMLMVIAFCLTGTGEEVNGLGTRIQADLLTIYMICVSRDYVDKQRWHHGRQVWRDSIPESLRCMLRTC